MAASWRLIDDLDVGASAADQMHADLALLDAVAQGGRPALRLYRWANPALSLGRFQAADEIDAGACARLGVEVVTRPTGGRALLHGGDVTYAVAFCPDGGRNASVDDVYERLAGAIVAGLAGLGVDAAIAHHRGETAPACFASQRGSDLRVGDRKLVGSAQVRRGDAVLQHGSVLVERLAFDETDLLAFATSVDRQAARRALRAATVTLRELGVGAGTREIGDSIVAGFASALDLDFSLDFRSTPFVARAGARR